MKHIPQDDKDCNLVFDSMAIRKKILYDSNEDKFFGYCDFGGIVAESQETPATEVLVFMLVGLKSKWKCPIGSFLQSKSTAIIQAGLVKTAIVMAKDVGMRVWGVTCDGTSTNLSTMTHFGCKLHGSYNELVEYFSISCIDWKVKIINNFNIKSNIL